jgi:hypothetical protein
MTRYRTVAVAAAVVAFSVMGSAPASAAPPHSGHHASQDQSLAFSAVAGEDKRFEVTLSGRRFTSRDEIEGRLLVEAARLTRRQGSDWFVLLPLPGERPGHHPTRANPAFGSRYGHWQPHWTYRVDSAGWQPWHPEWAAPFWTSGVDPRTVQEFQVHAMIEVGRGALPQDREIAFDARQVLSDVAAGFAAASSQERR